MEKAKCKYCEYCKKTRNGTGQYTNGRYRGVYMCENPDTRKLPQQAFGNKMAGFIGFGETVTYGDSKLATKTAPRWCPKNKK